MLTRLALLGLPGLLALLLVSPSEAQECVVGVYADDAGTHQTALLDWDPASGYFSVEVYYVVHFEGLVRGVAWSREVEVSAYYSTANLVASEVGWYPDGAFLEERVEGYRIGLGPCVSGVGGTPITVMKEVLYLDVSFNTPAIAGKFPSSASPFEVCTIRVLPNVGESTEYPMIDACTPDFLECGPGFGLTIHDGVPIEGASFGRVKATFR